MCAVHAAERGVGAGINYRELAVLKRPLLGTFNYRKDNWGNCLSTTTKMEPTNLKITYIYKIIIMQIVAIMTHWVL